MKVDVQEIGACKRRLEVEETPEVVREAWERAFTQVQKEARLRGFRKGKVPRSMIKLHFSDDVRQEVARRLIPEVYRQALAETQLHPVEEPDLQHVTLEESAPLKFSAVIEIRPVIALARYVGLQVTHTPKPFAETEVEQALAELQEQHAEYRSVERAADVGDLVIVDYTLTPDGMEARTETGYSFAIGGGTVLPEIDEAAIGLGAGGTRQTRVRFGDTHPNEPLRGKAADAQVRMVEVKEKVLPTLDDDFARSIGEFETLDALRAEIRQGLETRRTQENRRALENAVMDAALAEHTFEVPETLVLRQVASQIEHMREHMRRQGVDPDRLPWDYKKMAEELKPSAEKAVRRALLIEAIAEKEELQPTEAAVEAEIERMAKSTQRPPAAVRSMLERDGALEGLRISLMETKTLDFLIERATISP
ncbi:MAG TPA: trigger factor [Candidatus Methylomirabilis sp.]|nr:trigger factor [Candidatus Methylomirabilis sp.]